MIALTEASTVTSYLSSPITDHSVDDILSACNRFPMSSEPCVETWQVYEKEASRSSVWNVLHKRLGQLQFPIQSNISQTASYKAFTHRGICAKNGDSNEGLILEQPLSLILKIHQSIGGAIPILIVSNRADFVSLVQALTKRNEPAPIPESMGACMVAGYNNWDRIRTYRAQWTAVNPQHRSEEEWQAEFKRLLPQKELYQDRFIILHDGPYSGVPAADMGLDEAEWRELSLKIRLEHECTHYFTKRVLGVMRRHVFDELLADYAGIVAALGRFRADWFLRFMGLEVYPTYREGGRLQNYVEDLSAQDAAFQEVATCLKQAAENVARFDERLADSARPLRRQALVLLAICGFTLPELAAESAPRLLWERLCLLEKEADQAGG